MLKTSVQRFSFWWPYAMVCPQCTQISFCCFNSKALGDTFSITLNKDLLLLAHCRAGNSSSYTSPGLGNMTGQGMTVKSRTEFGFRLEIIPLKYGGHAMTASPRR